VIDLASQKKELSPFRAEGHGKLACPAQAPPLGGICAFGTNLP